MYLLWFLICERTLKTRDLSICVPNYLVASDVTTIGPKCFARCCSILESISFEQNPQIEVIGDYAFFYCFKLSSIDFSSCLNLKKIGNYAFAHCKSVTSIILPPNINEIGEYSFSYCINITDLDLSHLNIKIISNRACMQMNKLSSLILPNNLETISSFGFSSDYNLVNIDLPSSVINIHSNAFLYCKNLTTINIKTDSNLKCIGYEAFSGTKIQSIKLPKKLSNVTNFGVKDWTLEQGSEYLIEENDLLYSSNKETVFLYKGNSATVTIDQNVKHIQDYCFYECKTLQNIEMPQNLETIGSYAFSNCINLLAVNLYNAKYIGSHAFNRNKNLTCIDLPLSVKYIDDSAFSDCSELKTFEIPDSSELEFIGTSAFLQTKIKNIKLTKKLKSFTDIGIKEFTIDQGNPYLYEQDGFILSRNNETIFYYKGTETSITLKDEIRYISDYCFSSSPDIVSITFPPRLERIGEFAFLNSVLTSIDIQNVNIVGFQAFYLCTFLESVTIYNVSSIEYDAFGYCFALKSINITYVNSIQGNPFYPDDKVVSINGFLCENYKVINDTIISIKDNSVVFHAALSPVNFISIDCQKLEFGAFLNSQNLETIVLKNIREIELNALDKCKNLKYLYISNKLTLITEDPTRIEDPTLITCNTKLERVYVLYNTSSVIESLVYLKIEREKIFPWCPIKPEVTFIDDKHFEFLGFAISVSRQFILLF